MNYNKTGWNKKIRYGILLPFLEANIQKPKEQKEIEQVLFQNKIVEGDDQKTIDRKLENYKTLISEENQKAGVNYFIEAMKVYILSKL